MNNKTIPVQRGGDVSFARMQVRQMARMAGLSVTNQARVALATSSTAVTLGMGDICTGKIDIGCINEDGRSGIQVMCQTKNSTGERLGHGLNSVAYMVDKLTVDKLARQDVLVTLLKWA